MSNLREKYDYATLLGDDDDTNKYSKENAERVGMLMETN